MIRSSALVLAVLAARRVLRRHDRCTPERLGAHEDRALAQLRRWAQERSRSIAVSTRDGGIGRWRSCRC